MFLNHKDDAVGAAAEVHKAIFENEKIRVLDVVVPVGFKTAMHWHPKNMGYVLAAGKLRFVLPDGVVKDVELTEGQVTSGEGSHIVENIGDTEVRVLQVEFKD
ncbi:MAG: cytoplasmic protein [bacterium]|nr:cytoplasmic protein [bacterium]